MRCVMNFLLQSPTVGDDVKQFLLTKRVVCNDYKLLEHKHAPV